MAPYRPYFCEEPVPPENVAALAEVKRAVKVPIATGERLVTRFGFREVFERHAVHVIQPDLCHCGGLAEARKIAAMAETYYMGVAPHNPLGPIATAVAIQLDAAIPNFMCQEHRSLIVSKCLLVLMCEYVGPPTTNIGVDIRVV